MSITDDFVTVNVNIQDASPSPGAFGVVAAFVHMPGLSGWYKFTTDSDGLAAAVTAGVAVDTPAYAMLLAASKQNPLIDSVKFFSRPAPHAAVYTFTPTAQATGFKWTFDVSVDAVTYQTVTYVQLVSDTATTIVTALKAAIDALALAVTVNNGAGTSFTLTHTTSTKRAYFRNLCRGLSVTDTSTDTALAADIAAGIALDNEFFGMIGDSTLESAVDAAAAIAESNKKLFIALTVDSGCETTSTTDVGSDLKAAGYAFAAVYHTDDPGSWPNLGLLARQFSRPPGSSTFANKNVVGETIRFRDATQIANLRSKNILFQANVKGLRMTYDGKAGGGRFLDITYGAEWLKATMQALVLAVMAALEKIPYTNEGASLVEAQERAALDAAVAANFITPGYVIKTPKIPSETLSTDRANRYLPNMKWSATLAGAVHKVGINGTLSV